MIRVLMLLCAFLGAFSLSSHAETVARVDPAQSGFSAGWFGKTGLRLDLSASVPFRVFTLDGPPRLILDFQDVDWTGVSAQNLISDTDSIAAVRFGVFQPGWSRLVADLTQPMLPQDIAMAQTGRLTLTLAPVAAATFAAASGAPQSTLWASAETFQTVPPVMDDRFVVVIDPGHGGIDPGAEREGLSEKELMLDVAFSLQKSLRALGDVEAVLTRDRDMFVSLNRRVALAHQAGADMFISLHADALSQGGARGATIYTLSDEASDTATEHLAARHNRADVLAGVDLTTSDDSVTRVLLDMARRETDPRSEALARALADSMADAGGPMNRRPLRKAGFSVLKSADIPSVLVEVGFLSSKRDLENLRNPEWRARIVAAMAQGIYDWRTKDAARRVLLRQ